jgi:hypothetical protein
MPAEGSGANFIQNWNNFFAVEDTTVIHSRHAALLVG